jgi:hypothetical protein
MKRTATLLMVLAAGLCPLSLASATAADKNEEGFVSLFNGKDLSGWRISEDGKWRVEEGKIVANGARSHLFTIQEFKNFEFKAEVMTTPGSNSGIYFHTEYLPTGWPVKGYESQVNVTHRDTVKTGSLYGVVKLYKTPARDNEWWTHHIIVRGNDITVKINGETVIHYVEPEGVTSPIRISQGSFALQAHDPKSVVYYKNLRVKELKDPRVKE